ncbi:MAG: hypothetical protein ACFFEY_13750 [Candidatus Thorarchaeota archaeon]
MKKAKFLIAFLVLLSITLAITPPVIPQVGTYTFHGAPGNQKILRVRTVDSSGLSDLFGTTWNTILQDSFGDGCTTVGAGLKSVVVSVNTSAELDLTLFGLGIVDIATYVTDTWNWTVGAFSAAPHNEDVGVSSFYNPNTLSSFITIFYSFSLIDTNVSVQNAAIYLTQLPTDVGDYLGEIIWNDGWENVGNTIVHHALENEWSFFYSFQYLENCTEIWTYDGTYGAYIGYKILDDTETVIYEYNIELPGLPGIPGFEFSIILGVSLLSIIGLIFVITRKKR